MTTVFGDDYSNAYDLLYSDKDYAAECSLLRKIIQDYGVKPTRTILDLGCGTGNHALPLAEMGYEVTGIDRSEDMLAQARRKAPAVQFQSGDIRNVDLGRKFDAALMMFAVLGYQLENENVLAALQTAGRHLNPHGILIFDVWYGPAVLRLRPSERSKVIPTREGQMVRFASGELDIPQQICTVNYQVWRIQEDLVVSRVNESHRMRYFFPRELELLLDAAGFSHVRTGAFPEFEREPDETTWNVLVAAKVKSL